MKYLKFFKTNGRITRSSFWLSGTLVWLGLYTAWAAVGSTSPPLLTWLINGAALLALAVLCIRRLHDCNHSGWWLLVVVVPVIGALYLAWQLALRRGVPQDNRWGPDPLQRQGDYLVVR